MCSSEFYTLICIKELSDKLALFDLKLLKKIDGRTDEQTNEWMYEGTDERMDGVGVLKLSFDKERRKDYTAQSVLRCIIG